jgi:hypothetical protein
MKIHLEESESDLSKDSDENELYDDDVLYDGDYFTDKNGVPDLKILERW